jgi:hypothetical protein
MLNNIAIHDVDYVPEGAKYMAAARVRERNLDVVVL